MDNLSPQALLDALSRQAKILEEIRDELAMLRNIAFHSLSTDQQKAYSKSRVEETNRKMKSMADKRSQAQTPDT